MRSENITLSLNSFVNATALELGDHQINHWNTRSALTYRYGETMHKHTSPMGNYWGEAYNGTDQNGDGIGDTPFTGDGFTDIFPLMAPMDAYTFVEDTGDGDTGSAEHHNAAAAGNLQPGDVADLHFAGTAVSDVTITTAAPIPLITLTVNAVAEGPGGLNGPVYQYLETDIIHTTDDAVAEADFTFTVPTAWLTTQGLTPKDVVLWHYHDGIWVPLPTEIISEEGDHVVYRAVSPGFSYFAVAEGEAVPKQTAEPTPSAGVEAGTETGTPPTGTPIVTPAGESIAEPVIPSEAADDAPKAAATSTPPQQSPAGLCTILAAFGTVGLLFRRR